MPATTITAPVAVKEADAPRSISLTTEERKDGAYGYTNLQKAVEAMHQDGFVVLKGVVNVDHVRALNSFMTAEADDILEAKAKEENPFWNQGVASNFLQGPPVTRKELLFNDIYFNPYVVQVVNFILGPRPTWNFLTANTAIKGTDGLRQRVHKDNRADHPLAPYMIIANVPLVDFSPENGSTEFWLGTHAHTTGADQDLSPPDDPLGPYDTFIKTDVLEARREARPPIQPFAKQGDITLRDVRLWHAGMPNPSSEHRIMLAVGYQASWFQNPMTTVLPKVHEEFFRGPKDIPIQVRADFVNGEDDLYARKNNDFLLRARK